MRWERSQKLSQTDTTTVRQLFGIKRIHPLTLTLTLSPHSCSLTLKYPFSLSLSFTHTRSRTLKHLQKIRIDTSFSFSIVNERAAACAVIIWCYLHSTFSSVDIWESSFRHQLYLLFCKPSHSLSCSLAFQAHTHTRTHTHARTRRLSKMIFCCILTADAFSVSHLADSHFADTWTNRVVGCRGKSLIWIEFLLWQIIDVENLQVQSKELFLRSNKLFRWNSWVSPFCESEMPG